MTKKIEFNNELVYCKYNPVVNLWYPRLDDSWSFVDFGLMDVRAASDIRISYDFERDGWVIQQPTIFEWDINDKICDEGWMEVSFIPAWLGEELDGGVEEV